jgi:selenoprotein W-related protein
LRAAWWAAELYNTFGESIGELLLKPGPVGSFEIAYDGELLYSMLKTGKHADFNEVRDIIAERLKVSPTGGPET